MTMTIAARASTAANIKHQAKHQIRLHVAPSYNDRPLRILCATDLWARSDYAVQRALTLAQALDAEALLLHVVDEEAPLRMLGRRAEHAHSAMQWRVRQFRRLDTLPRVSVRIGNPYRTIVRVARDWDADLIVLGSHRTRTADWLLGTTAERLGRAVDRPVLIVNRDASRPYAAVTLAIRSMDAAAPLARMTHELGLLDHARASIVHTLGPPGRRTSSSASDLNVQRGKDSNEMRGSSLDEIEARLEAAGLNPRSFAIVQQNAAQFDVAANTAGGKAPQLLVTNTGRFAMALRALGLNMANRLLRLAECDVLIASEVAARRACARAQVLEEDVAAALS